jgi:hypothetical protein
MVFLIYFRKSRAIHTKLAFSLGKGLVVLSRAFMQILDFPVHDRAISTNPCYIAFRLAEGDSCWTFEATIQITKSSDLIFG